MGKVLKTIAVIAVAAAVAYFAPYLAGTVLGLSGLAATVATAAIGATLSLAAGLALKAISGPPSATVTVHAHSARLPIERDTLAPIGPPGWRNALFLPGARFAIEPAAGGCMSPVMEPGSWMILDRLALIRAGDLIAIRVGDQRRYYAPRWRSSSALSLWYAAIRTPMIKRFVGIGGGRLIFEHTNPPAHIETDLAGVDVLYRVRAVEPSLWRAWRTWWRVRRDPDAYDQRLGV